MHAHKCRKYGKILLLILQKLQTKIVEDKQLLKILNGNCDELYVVLETIYRKYKKIFFYHQLPVYDILNILFRSNILTHVFLPLFFIRNEEMQYFNSIKILFELIWN